MVDIVVFGAIRYDSGKGSAHKWHRFCKKKFCNESQLFLLWFSFMERQTVGFYKLSVEVYYLAFPSCRVLVCGTANGWFLRMSTRVHIDQIIIALSHNCQKLERLEIQWEPDTIRSSDNSSKFIDQLRYRVGFCMAPVPLTSWSIAQVPD